LLVSPSCDIITHLKGSNALKPAKISVSKSEAVLHITWENETESRLPLAGLRAACPCAECKGGHENMGQPGSPSLMKTTLKPGQSASLERVELVGNYAIQMVWGDGHAYGIYSWAYLQDLCPPVPLKKEDAGE